MDAERLAALEAQAVLSRELSVAARILWKVSWLDLQRSTFLSRISDVLLETARADALDLWLERGDFCYRWQTGRARDTVSRLAKTGPVVPSVQSALRTPPLSPPELLLAAIREQHPDIAAICLRSKRTENGTLWVADGRQRTAPAAPEGDPEPGECVNSELVYCSHALLPFSIDVANSGLLHVRGRQPRLFGEHNIQSLEELAHLVGAAVGNRRTKMALAERIKELGCMYSIERIAGQHELSLDDALQSIVNLLPPAWQYPDLASARISLDRRSFVSPRFVEGPHCLAADLCVHGEVRGNVEVFYRDRGDEMALVRVLGESPFLDEEEDLILGVARQVTFVIERKHAQEEHERLQEQLRHADRLATIGQLAAGVAHELNEPLGNILGFAQLLLKSSTLSECQGRDVDKIVRASLHARQIINQLMLFARQTASRKTKIDVNQAVKEAVYFLEARCAKEGIQLVLTLSEDVPPVFVDPSELQQVLVNLIVNAIQATGEGGRLDVKTLSDSSDVLLAVEDTGPGIAPDILTKIFLPFFTTKDVGEGTGLGLSVVHGIVCSHGGRVDVDSQLGRGTRFEVRLPAALDEGLEGGSDAIES